MERRRSFLGWFAIGLGVLVLLGALGGGLRAHYGFSHAPQRAVLAQQDQRGWQDQQDQQDWGGRGRGMAQSDPRGGWQGEPGSQGFQAAPRPPQPPQAPRPPRFPGGHGHGFGWLIALPLMLLGSILRFALFAAVAYGVVRWLQRREARRNQDPPAQPPHTGDTQSL